jgi:hypothetical protein
MCTDAPDQVVQPKRVLYERIFIDRAFAEDTSDDRPSAERPETGER